MMKYFFLAGHVHYARYLTQYLLEMASLPSDAKVDFVSQYHPGYYGVPFVPILYEIHYMYMWAYIYICGPTYINVGPHI